MDLDVRVVAVHTQHGPSNNEMILLFRADELDETLTQQVELQRLGIALDRRHTHSLLKALHQIWLHYEERTDDAPGIEQDMDLMHIEAMHETNIERNGASGSQAFEVFQQGHRVGVSDVCGTPSSTNKDTIQRSCCRFVIRERLNELQTERVDGSCPLSDVGV